MESIKCSLLWAAQTVRKHHGWSLSTTTDVFRPTIELKNGLYTCRKTMWFCNMTTLGNMLQNGCKSIRKRLNGALPQDAVFTRHCPAWLSLAPIDGIWSGWSAVTFLWRCQDISWLVVSVWHVILPTWNLNAFKRWGKNRCNRLKKSSLTCF